MSGRVLLIGGTRGTGCLAARALMAAGRPVRVLARNSERARRALGKAADIVPGDITKPATLDGLFDNVEAVIFTAGLPPRPAREAAIKATDYDGVVNTLAAAKRAGFHGRFLYMSSMGADTPSVISAVLNTIKTNVLVWRKRAEDAVRESGLPYTIVRAGFLTNGPAGKTIAIGAEPMPLRLSCRISRANVARVLVDMLDDDRVAGTTVDAYEQ